MIRIALALVALALPALVAAEDIYRWRDAAGVLHYSNQPAHVPSDAAQLGTRPDGVPGAPTPVPARQKPETPEAPRAASRQEV